MKTEQGAPTATLPALEASVDMHLEVTNRSGLGVAVSGQGEIKAANSLSLLLMAQAVLEAAVSAAVKSQDFLLAAVLTKAAMELAVVSPGARMTEAAYEDMVAKHKASQQ